MPYLLNWLVIRPFLRSVTWAKRNPGLTVIFAAGAWWLVTVMLPWGMKATFQGVLGFLFGRIFKVLHDIPLIGPVSDWVYDRLIGWVWTVFQWLSALVIAQIFPPLGVFVILWQMASTVNNTNARAEFATSYE